MFSPQHTNEDNHALARLARDIWRLERFYVGGKPPVPERADKILRDADVNANRRGIRAILGGEHAAGASVLEEDLLEGEIKALLVLGHHLPLSDEALARLGQLDALSSSPTPRRASPRGPRSRCPARPGPRCPAR